MATDGTWPLIGRDADRESVMAAVTSGRGVVIRGPAGVGETRLVDDVVAAVAAQALTEKLLG